MADAAAFFDLDRTLLLGGSGPTISRSLRDVGLIKAEAIPGERAAFQVFNVVGETLPSILVTRQGARAARGWPLTDVRKAADAAAEDLEGEVEPFALEAIAEHRAAGRKLVLATTTPFDLVKPLADRLGFDDVLATRYRVDETGEAYDGTIDGEFVWSFGKARSVGAWAMANRIELADSHAYSDSIFDVPMLSKVGYPVAVNPDPRLLVYATAKGWPKVWFNAPPGVPKPVGVELQTVMSSLAKPELFPWLDIRIDGADRLPLRGGVVVAANHRSYLDPMLITYLAAEVGRPVRFLAKKEVTDAGLIGAVAKAFGAIRVDRARPDGSSMTEAARAVRAGELVAIFPQGTIPRGPAFFEPELQGRGGAVRLAIDTGAPIVPVGVWGSERAWPRSSSMPYVLNVADPPTVSVAVGSPYHPVTEDVAEETRVLMARIVDLLPPQARKSHEPTGAELARTYPSKR